MMRMLLQCEVCGKETDMLPQLLSCAGWEERDSDTLEPVWGGYIRHTISCDTEDCKGCWGIEMYQTEWVELTAAAEAERANKQHLEELKQAVQILQEARKGNLPGNCTLCFLSEARGRGPYCDEHYQAARALEEAQRAVIECAEAFIGGLNAQLTTE